MIMAPVTEFTAAHESQRRPRGTDACFHARTNCPAIGGGRLKAASFLLQALDHDGV